MEELGFQLKRRQSSRVSPEVITDLDFANDIPLLSEQSTQAQEMLTRVEQASSEVGLRASGNKNQDIGLQHRWRNQPENHRWHHPRSGG